MDARIEKLVDKYFDQIEIEDADYVPFDDAKSDAAYLLLDIPTEMLKEYLKIKGQRKKLPAGAEFWKETGLVERLGNSKKHIEQFHSRNFLDDSFEFLSNFLFYLIGDVQADYQELITPPGRIRLSITEIPIEFYEDSDF